MILKIVESGSSGNCYLLIADNGEKLILDCGALAKEIKKGLDWEIRNVSGCVVTHQHGDHACSAKYLSNIGIPVFAPALGDASANFKGEWIIRAFELRTVDGKWTHTNGDGSECPCYGFWIQHPEMGTMIYATDTELIKWRFKNVNHILLGVNYDQELLSGDDAKKNHVVRGHMSIDTACEFVKANASDQLQSVIMCHLSSENADSDSFIEKMKKVAYGANVDVAVAGKSWDLKNPSECPF